MKKNCYLTNTENIPLTINSGNHKPTEKNWLRKTVKTGMVTLTAYQIMVNSFTFIEFVISANITIYGDFPAIQIVKTGMVTLTAYQIMVNSFTFIEFVISANITIYGDFLAIQIQLTEITEIYLRLWESDGSTVRVPSEKRIPIDILPDVNNKNI